MRSQCTTKSEVQDSAQSDSPSEASQDEDPSTSSIFHASSDGVDISGFIRIAPVHIGNQFTHDSHHPFSLRGFYFCKRCCYFTQGGTLKRLAFQCGSPTAHGIAARNKLSAGSLPAGVLNWPDEKPNSAFTSESLVLTKLSRLLDAEAKKLYIDSILHDYKAPCNLQDLDGFTSADDSNATPVPSPVTPLTDDTSD